MNRRIHIKEDGWIMRVVGIDGCKHGWIAVSWDSEAKTLTPSVHVSFPEVLAAHKDAAVIAVDIPIGLNRGPRQCDVEARKLLKWKHPAVFPAPDPRLVHAATYGEASVLSRELTGKGLSVQTFALFPKIADVNEAMTPEMQGRIFEVHPEVSFWAMAGEPMRHPKRKAEGIEERRRQLQKALGIDIWTRAEAAHLVKPAKADDVLDAIAAAWTAQRLIEGEAVHLPAEPEVDERGLRMEIVY